MKIWLTGATGFVGASFARLALDRDHEIAGLVRNEKLLSKQLRSNKKFVLLKGSLSEAPWQAIESFKPSVCVHSAWIATPGVYLESPENPTYFESSLTFLKK